MPMQDNDAHPRWQLLQPLIIIVRLAPKWSGSGKGGAAAGWGKGLNVYVRFGFGQVFDRDADPKFEVGLALGLGWGDRFEPSYYDSARGVLWLDLCVVLYAIAAFWYLYFYILLLGGVDVRTVQSGVC
ncbi:hypothetical protein FA15DRAFT_255897 [Coprinopsis marcescibilis]|uniref:Uncharacterized protein n=1 Tax=Coprinopsis marcescibilis TaxID=230819 RepID=A0A5C3L1D8_COPMA|nr:hypothetical protein FA15DRAFT_255897 [Coprinopsis marcescibilis]